MLSCCAACKSFKCPNKLEDIEAFYQEINKEYGIIYHVDPFCAEHATHYGYTPHENLCSKCIRPELAKELMNK